MGFLRKCGRPGGGKKNSVELRWKVQAAAAAAPKQPFILGKIAMSSVQKCATQERLCPVQFVQAKNKVSVMCKDLNFEPEETLRGRVSFSISRA